MEINSIGNNINTNDSLKHYHQHDDLKNIINNINNDDNARANKSVQPGDKVIIDDGYQYQSVLNKTVRFPEYYVKVDSVAQIRAEMLFGYPQAFNSAQSRWNYSALLKQGVINKGDDSATVREKLEPHKTGDYDLILGALSKVWFARGAFVDSATGEPYTGLRGTVAPVLPNTVFLNTNVRTPTFTVYHELTHVLQLNGVVEYVPKAREDRDYYIADEFAEGKLLFHELGPEQQAQVVAAYATGRHWSTLIG